MLKILVTGGFRFIGTNSWKELKSRKYDVVSCDLYNTNRDNHIRCDVKNYRQLEK